MDKVKFTVTADGTPAIEYDARLSKEEEQSMTDFIQAVSDMARNNLIKQIKEIRDRESNYGDYDYYYGLDALLEELGKE
jgi:hypothetical protein